MSNFTLKEWRDRAAASTRCSPEKLDRIADLCANHPELFPNGNPSIWHATWLAFDRAFDCNCWSCTNARGK